MSSIKSLLEVAHDEFRPAIERLEALRQADVERKAKKVGWAKLGYEPEYVANLVSDLEHLVSLPEPTTETEVTPREESAELCLTMAEARATCEAGILVYPYGDTVWLLLPSLVGSDDPFEMSTDELEQQVGRPTSEAEEPVVRPARGEVGRLVMQLLEETDMDYSSIVGQVRERWPTAKTTARSIASVAADMRRDGIEVAMRRTRK